MTEEEKDQIYTAKNPSMVMVWLIVVLCVLGGIEVAQLCLHVASWLS